MGENQSAFADTFADNQIMLSTNVKGKANPAGPVTTIERAEIGD